jgi:hypothetical protein
MDEMHEIRRDIQAMKQDLKRVITFLLGDEFTEGEKKRICNIEKRVKLHDYYFYLLIGGGGVVLFIVKVVFA